ncbi:hypothetical protein BJY00DRAFT_278173 [Aspergillus carlsbadensis]|nr:hypothetical protein BJY00DRAFT_278173 [Aspergillus carlsbadensis]
MRLNEMTRDQDLEILRFMELPFDNYNIEHWDPDSPLPKHEQKQSLVERWICLGERGRRQYFEPRVYEHEIPTHVPRDLLTPQERAVDGQYSGILWIRTWFGKSGDSHSRLNADNNYKRLCLYALKGCDEQLERPEFLHELCLFEAPDVAPSDLLEGNVLATPCSTPSWLVSAFMHCPDQLSGVSYDNTHEGEESDDGQQLLVCVADRKACEDGFVLLIGVNHKGQILPYRVRKRAAFIFLIINDWDEDAIELRQWFANRDAVEGELYLETEGGWSVMGPT